MNTREFLLESGVLPNLLGFNYIIRAVEIVKQKGRVQITKELYPTIAREFNTSASKVERAIRHALFDKIDVKSYQKIGLKQKPTNSEFIYYFAIRGEKYGK